jgi:hypothetical protein
MEITNASSRKNKQVNVLMVLAIVWIGAGAFPRTGEQSETAKPPTLNINVGGGKNQIPQPAAFLPNSTFGSTKGCFRAQSLHGRVAPCRDPGVSS